MQVKARLEGVKGLKYTSYGLRPMRDHVCYCKHWTLNASCITQDTVQLNNYLSKRINEC